MVDKYNFAMEFSEYIAERHFVLVNVEYKIYNWENETEKKTTVQLMSDFVNSKQK